MSLMMKLVRDRMLKARNGGDPPAEKKKEVSLTDMTLDNISKIEKVFPGASDLLKETAIIESKMGRDTRAGKNVFQLTEIGIDAVKDIKSHPGLKKYHQKIKDNFGYDIMNASYQDFKTDPMLNALGARMMYAKVPDPVPGTVEGRADYWSNFYNTKADSHGTSDAFLKQVKEFKY